MNPTQARQIQYTHSTYHGIRNIWNTYKQKNCPTAALICQVPILIRVSSQCQSKSAAQWCNQQQRDRKPSIHSKICGYRICGLRKIMPVPSSVSLCTTLLSDEIMTILHMWLIFQLPGTLALSWLGRLPTGLSLVIFSVKVSTSCMKLSWEGCAVRSGMCTAPLNIPCLSSPMGSTY